MLMPKKPLACHRSVPDCMSHVAAVCLNVCGMTFEVEASAFHGKAEGRPNAAHGMPVPLHDIPEARRRFQHQDMREQARRKGNGGLAFVRLPLALRAPLVHAALNIHER